MPRCAASWKDSWPPSPALKVEAVADLAGELAGIVPVGAAKGVGVVEQVARIAEILRGEAYREALAERFGERQGKFGVVGKVSRAFAVEETGTVGNVAGSGDVPRQRGVEAEAERVALIVIEVAEAAAFAELALL